MYVVQVAERISGNVAYLNRGKLVQQRSAAQPYPHPSAAQRAIASHKAAYVRAHGTAGMPPYEYEVLPDRPPIEIISLPNGDYRIRKRRY